MENLISVATAVTSVEPNPVPPVPGPMWAGTLSGVMAGKRPPKGSPRVEFVAAAEPTDVAVAVGVD